MSLISQGVGLSLSLLAAGAAQVTQYRLTPAGSWTAWPAGTGAFLQQSPPIVIGFDAKRGSVVNKEQARIKVAYGAVHLTPGVGGSQVKDQNGTVWMVVGLAHALGQSIYQLERTIAESMGADRGTVP